jgi:hypothetical protein
MFITETDGHRFYLTFLTVSYVRLRYPIIFPTTCYLPLAVFHVT